MSNIYEKITKARKAFKDMNVPKTGKNAYAGYTYFELSDILKAVTDINEKLGLAVIENFTAEEGQLRIVNTEDPKDFATFAVPMEECQLKGCHPVQCLGASITYVRRYLYQNAYSVSEPDQLDRLDLKGDEGYHPKPGEEHKGLVARTKALTRQANFINSVKAIDGWEAKIKALGYNSVEEIPDSDFRKVYTTIKEAK